MKPITIGVAGGTGSGKTTVALKILERVGLDRIAYLSHDAYYRDASNLPPAERAQLNFDHPESLDNELLIQHVRQLQADRPVEVPGLRFQDAQPPGRDAPHRSAAGDLDRGHPDLRRQAVA